ncbi:MAG: AraC family transcriptional regulator [Bacteroidales bacterium]|jgi:AraC-like DNA-binding protein|nr:AraC family transcriptional regulator [Bacteroidales bacterium]
MAKLLYVKEHLRCYHYDSQDSPTIGLIDFEKNQKKSMQINSHSIFIILNGSGSISYGKFVNRPIKAGDIFLLPIYTHVQFYLEKTFSALVYRLPLSFHFCDHFSLEALYSQGYKPEITDDFQILKVNERIKLYLNALIPCLKDGLKCVNFLELKRKELLFLLRAYNTKEDLAFFFSPVLTDDMEFYAFVLDNYQSIKTVKELALLADYGLTGFEKRFRKVFGMSAHQWMKNQLSDSIYHEITCSKKSFTEISDIYGFSSSAHLSNFCKLVFGATPSSIRKKMSMPEPAE